MITVNVVQTRKFLLFFQLSCYQPINKMWLNVNREQKYLLVGFHRSVLYTCLNKNHLFCITITIQNYQVSSNPNSPINGNVFWNCHISLKVQNGDLVSITHNNLIPRIKIGRYVWLRQSHGASLFDAEVNLF